MGQGKASCIFSVTGCWDLGTIFQFEPVLGKLQADNRWNCLSNELGFVSLCPQLTVLVLSGFIVVAYSDGSS